MVTGADLSRLLAELQLLHERQLEMWPTLGDLGKEVSDEFLEECVSAAQSVEVKFRELRTIRSQLLPDEWDVVLAECREKCPAALSQFVGWL
jgi:hypothetical protein